MGGNIWQSSVRLCREDYDNTVLSIIELVKGIDPAALFETIDYVREKDSFGDLDILVLGSVSKFRDYFTTAGIAFSKNGSVLSALINNFQIDFIFAATPEELAYSKNYYSWNDAGNIVGRLSKSLGFKHGHNGLFYIHRSEQKDRILSTTLLTTDYFKILDILKLDVEKFKLGFDTYIELFDWVSQSPYFNKNIYAYENLNHANKVRDRKRKTYNMFLSYCENLQEKFTYKFDRQSAVVYNFPELTLVLKEDFLRESLNKKLKENFGGDKILSLITLEPYALGRFIHYLKSQYSREMLLSYLEQDCFNSEKFILQVYADYCV
jgi:hypothetical protein